MNNRMGVLSRRLGRFAGGFTVATFACFLLGLFATANNKEQLVLIAAGLASVCLFAAFFLWLAHGFAWALIPERPSEVKRPAEALRPAEPLKPAEPMKSAEVKRPIEALKPVEPVKPVEENKIEEEEDLSNARYTITGKRIY
jgi:hypothetical protein